MNIKNSSLAISLFLLIQIRHCINLQKKNSLPKLCNNPKKKLCPNYSTCISNLWTGVLPLPSSFRVSPPSLSSGLPPRRRWPWWPALGGMEVWSLVVGSFELYSPVNKVMPGSGDHLRGLGSSLPRGDAIGEVAEESLVSGDESCASAHSPVPWQDVASAASAPISPILYFSCCNKSQLGGALQ